MKIFASRKLNAWLDRVIPRFWLESRLAVYAEIFQSHPYPILLCDNQRMRIVGANRQALALYESTLDDLRTTELVDWLPPGLLTSLGAGDWTAAATCFDTKHRLRSGREFPVRLSVLSIASEPRFFGLVCLDRTEAALLERLLQDNAEQMQRFLEMLPLPAWLEDHEGQSIIRNEHYRKLPVCQIPGNIACCQGEWRDAVECGLHGTATDSYLQQLREQVLETGDIVTRRVSLGGCGAWLFVLFPVTSAGGRPGVGGMAIEVDAVHRERARADAVEDQLRSLASSLQAAREEERRSVSRAIHDELGQEITALQMALAQLRSGLRNVSPGVWEPSMKTVDQIVLTIVEEARRIMVNLRPEMVYREGLVPASSALVTDMRQRLGIRGTFQAIPPGQWDVEPDIALHIYRSLQSLLGNVARHSKASRFDVILESVADGVWLTVSDDGAGIGADVAPGPKQLGLRGLRERAALHGGDLTIRTRPEVDGTTVSLFLRKSEPMSLPDVDVELEAEHNRKEIHVIPV